MVWTKEYREISGTVVGFLFHNDARWFGSDAIRLSRKEQGAAKYLGRPSPRFRYEASRKCLRIDRLEIKNLQEECR